MLEQKLTVDNVLFPNRVVLSPMEGCDCAEDGTPGELTVKKYISAAGSAAGTIWFEASAVCPEGRTNARQMMLTEANLPAFRALTDAVRETAQREHGIDPVLILQLTHSGRQSLRPMIAYRNPVYEKTRPAGDENIVTDAYLDTLPELYAQNASLACAAGFDGVDVKSCHGYLLQELLSAFDRPGRYGGSFENRARLYLNCVEAVKAAVPSHTLLCSRLSVSDMVPYPYGFGTNANGELDLREPDLLLAALVKAGIRLLNVTVGNPYYNPHVNRPFRKGAYVPPEPPENGLARFVAIEKHIKARFPELYVSGSGLSFYRRGLFEKAEALLREGVCDLVGFGRMWLAYPGFYRDYLAGCFDPKKCCVACSRCTELMRAGRPSGCAVFNGIYKESYAELRAT